MEAIEQCDDKCRDRTSKTVCGCGAHPVGLFTAVHAGGKHWRVGCFLVRASGQLKQMGAVVARQQQQIRDLRTAVAANGCTMCGKAVANGFTLVGGMAVCTHCRHEHGGG